jgi:hypothetical protein
MLSAPEDQKPWSSDGAATARQLGLRARSFTEGSWAMGRSRWPTCDVLMASPCLLSVAHPAEKNSPLFRVGDRQRKVVLGRAQRRRERTEVSDIAGLKIPVSAVQLRPPAPYFPTFLNGRSPRGNRRSC